MNYIAHRGVVDKNTRENTIKAFKKTISSEKFIGFELDIRVSKDKIYFVYHNYLLRGIPLKKYSSKELTKLKIPKLSDVLKLKTNKIILIELKDFDMDINDFVNYLNKFNNLNIYVMSFSYKLINKISLINHNFKIGVLNYILNTPLKYNFDFIVILNGLLKKEKLKLFNNIEIFSYGIINNKNLLFDDVYYIIDSDLVDF